MTTNARWDWVVRLRDYSVAVGTVQVTLLMDVFRDGTRWVAWAAALALAGPRLRHRGGERVWSSGCAS